MRTGLIVHAMLLMGNIGLFLGMSSGQGVLGGRGVETTALETIRREQAQLRGELARLRSEEAVPRLRSAQQAVAGGNCKESGEDAPGVTVYLETTPEEAASRTDAQRGQRQWTSVSFKEAGQAPDGSKQAVMSIHKTEVKSSTADFMPTHAGPHWQ